MTGREPNLGQVQRWMQSVIMHPGGVEGGVDSAGARAHLDVPLSELETVIKRSLALSGQERLEIYVTSYYERLLECLREEFAVTRGAIGDDLFDGLAFGYLQHYPSHSYTLQTLGEKFPQFLEETRLHARSAPEGVAESWPELVIELSQFERLVREVFDGPGSERRPAVSREEILRAIQQDGGHVQVTLCPSLKLAQFEHPVLEYWDVLKSGDQIPPPSRTRTWVVISRRDYSIEKRGVGEVQFWLLWGLTEQVPLAQAIAAAVGRVPQEAAPLEGSLTDWFAQWLAHGWIAGV